MPKNKHDDFRSFLKNRLQLTDVEIPVSGEWSNMANTIGAVALRSNILSLEKIELVLDMQETIHKGKLFGQIAVERGFLTLEEIDRLLVLQKYYLHLAIASQSMLRGHIDFETMLDLVRDFNMPACNA